MIEVDASMVAKGLGLETEQFRRLMADKRIKVLCERDTDGDLGLFRFSFYYQGRRLRFVTDEGGNVAQAPL